MRHQNVRNADEVEAREMIKGRHNMRLRQLGKPAGSRALGATLTEVAPGAVSFPRHAHHANEEAIYVLSGSGEARIGEERVAVRPRMLPLCDTVLIACALTPETKGLIDAAALP